MNFKYKIEKKWVRYIRLEIKEDIVKLILPHWYKGDPIRILEEKRQWIEEKLKEIEKRKKEAEKFPLHEIKNFESKVYKMIDRYAKFLGRRPKVVNFKVMKGRWGSCSSKGDITINKVLKYLPEVLIDYVVAHEMTHLLVPSHKREFYDLLKKIMPDYKKREVLLRSYEMKLKELSKKF